MEASTRPRTGATVPGTEPEPEVLGGPEQESKGATQADINEAQARDGIPDDKDELSAKEANTALERMLSVETPELPTETVNMQALADRQGWPEFKITVRALGEEEFTKIGERAERPPNKRERENGQTMPVVDQPRLKRLLVIYASMDPDFSDQSLLSKFGPSPDHVIQRWLLPGEIDQLADIITDLSGWAKGSLLRAKK